LIRRVNIEAVREFDEILAESRFSPPLMTVWAPEYGQNLRGHDEHDEYWLGDTALL
jgi:hypothetical protein